LLYEEEGGSWVERLRRRKAEDTSPSTEVGQQLLRFAETALALVIDLTQLGDHLKYSDASLMSRRWVDGMVYCGKIQLYQVEICHHIQWIKDRMLVQE